jgi:2-polyprenyl-3-methyl-5-hydroxy-6-metoxy-1,4-benzoquinol methylase
MQRPTSYFQGTRPELAEFLPDDYSRILEIGCGEGHFHMHLRHNCEYWGIEPDHDAARVASKQLQKVLVGTFHDVFEQLPNNYFDLIICNDVIEHIADHDEFFQSIKIKIKNHCYFIGSIPNVRFISNLIELLIKKDWKYKEKGILDKTHLRFFTEKSLERTMKENGFIIEALKGINGVKFRPVTLKRLKQNLWIFLLGRDSRFMQFGFRMKYIIPSSVQ